MDGEMIYNLAGLGIFGVIAYFVMRSDVPQEVQKEDENDDKYT